MQCGFPHLTRHLLQELLQRANFPRFAPINTTYRNMGKVSRIAKNQVLSFPLNGNGGGHRDPKTEKTDG